MAPPMAISLIFVMGKASRHLEGKKSAVSKKNQKKRRKPLFLIVFETADVFPFRCLDDVSDDLDVYHLFYIIPFV